MIRKLNLNIRNSQSVFLTVEKEQVQTMKIGIMGGSADLSLVKGALYLAACLPMGIVGWISGASQGKAAAASIGLVAKRPEQFGKAMIFPAMVETYAILALLISILSIFGIAGLNI